MRRPVYRQVPGTRAPRVLSPAHARRLPHTLNQRGRLRDLPPQSPSSYRRVGRGTFAALAGGSRRRARGPDGAGESGVRRRRCAGPDPGRLLGLRDRPPHPGAGGVERPRQEVPRPAAPLRRVPAHPALELRHGHRPEPVPVAVPGGHQDRRLPDGAVAQGAAPRPCEPVHRRRHRPRQDHRGRPDRPRAAAAQESAHRGRRRPGVGPGAMESGDGGALRSACS